MKIIRYQDKQGTVRYGQLTGTGAAEELKGDPFDGLKSTGRPADMVKLLAPIAPVAILGVGLNYRKHAAESGLPVFDRPVLFFKGINTVQNPGDPVELPVFQESTEVDYECELAVVIGKTCKNVSVENALDYVLGYTGANDVSSRDWQFQFGGGQWCKGKSFDTFTPLGPCIVTTDEIADPGNLRLSTVLNGETVQDSNTSDMIFDVPTIVSFLSGSTTLYPGTVILTGTPEGVAFGKKPPIYLKEGDQMTVTVEGIGDLHNPVINEPT